MVLFTHFSSNFRTHTKSRTHRCSATVTCNGPKRLESIVPHLCVAVIPSGASIFQWRDWSRHWKGDEVLISTFYVFERLLAEETKWPYCLVSLSCRVVSCLILSCLVVSCLALSYLILYVCILLCFHLESTRHLEEGVGQGPRKELFGLFSAHIVSGWTNQGEGEYFTFHFWARVSLGPWPYPLTFHRRFLCLLIFDLYNSWQETFFSNDTWASVVSFKRTVCRRGYRKI